MLGFRACFGFRVWALKILERLYKRSSRVLGMLRTASIRHDKRRLELMRVCYKALKRVLYTGCCLQAFPCLLGFDKV